MMQRTLWTTLLALPLFTTAVIVPADPENNITWPYHEFKTVDFNPPLVNMTDPSASSLAPGYIFFAPDGATPFQESPLIVDQDGELVWNGPVPSHAFNFGVYEYKGEKVLGWWNGTLFPEPVGRGNGVIHLLDNSYNDIATVRLAGNFLELNPGVTYQSNIDVHELFITSKDTMVVTANNVTQADLSSVGGPVNGWTVDAQVYEIDIETNEVLFSWSYLDHLDAIPFTAAILPLGAEGFTGQNQSLAWNPFHINSAEPYNGGYILSSRYFCSAIAIDGSGEVVWRLSGREGGDYALVGSDDVTGFCFQHDIRLVEERDSGLTIRMHDNHNSPIENNTVPSTAKILDLNFDTMEASLVERYFNESGLIFSTAQANYQPLPNGNHFIGRGWVPVMEEFSPAGEPLNTIQFGAAEPRPGGGYFSAEAPTLSYRDFKQPWVGCPETAPDVVAESSSEGTTVYVSWNGATEVTSWAVYGGNAVSKLKHLKTVPKMGFETEVAIGSVKYVQVKPVMKQGCACKTTKSSSAVAVA